MREGNGEKRVKAKAWLIGAATALCAWGAGTAWAFDQAPPEAVMEPYRAYVQAVEADDLALAARWAEQAYQAGRQAALDPELMAALAENRAQIYADIADHGRARSAFEDLAALHQAQGADAETRADALGRAARAALVEEEWRRAYRLAEQAVGVIGANPTSSELYLARSVQATAEWSRSRYRQAGQRAQEALAVLEAVNGVTSEAAVLSFYAGIGAAFTRDHAEAAYYFTGSTALLRRAGEDREGWLIPDAWSTYSRSMLDEAERVALLERLQSGLFAAFLFDEDEDKPKWIDEGGVRVDAVPLHRQPPSYPQAAARNALNGVSLHRFNVTADGRIESVETLHAVPNPVFGIAGERAIQNWIYEPALIDGEPVAREGVITSFEYRISNR